MYIKVQTDMIMNEGDEPIFISLSTSKEKYNGKWIEPGEGIELPKPITLGIGAIRTEVSENNDKRS